MQGGTESTFTGDGTNGVSGQMYRVHQFTTTGASTLTVTQFPKGATCEVLVVGGGGAGAKGDNNYGGPGGGAGGVVQKSMRLDVGSHTITVGAGGTGGTWNVIESGRNTTAFGITAFGGGRASSVNTNTAATTFPYMAQRGASTGGGHNATAWADTTEWGPVYPYNVPGQGNLGGTGSTGTGGGGGAGAVGGNGTGGAPGAGGIGVQSYITGTGTYYGGGGGGSMQSGGATTGAGGAGGGGTGGISPTSGTANTGGGGGGSTGTNGSGSGGSGIVVVRYTI